MTPPAHTSEPMPASPRPTPSPTLARRAVRRAAHAALAAALLAAGAAPALAQAVSVARAPVCAALAACGTLRFTIAAPGALAWDALTLTSATDAWTFAPAAGPGTFAASDDFGGFGGFTESSLGGSRLFVDFVGSGAPFTLAGGGSGWVDVAVAERADAPPFAFTFEAAVAGGGTVRGAVTSTAVVPEPATVVLLATGLAALGLVARRRRTAG